VGVLGAGDCNEDLAGVARALGLGLARLGVVVVCGGLGGVMAAVAEGVREGGGITVGILPGEDKQQANRFIDIPIATGLAEARNLVIIRTADILVAVGGSYGTLSEIAFALKMGKGVIGLKTWQIEGVKQVATVEEILVLIEKKEDR